MVALGVEGDEQREQGEGVASVAACVGGQGFAAAGCPNSKRQRGEGEPQDVLQVIGEPEGSLKMLCTAVAAEQVLVNILGERGRMGDGEGDGVDAGERQGGERGADEGDENAVAAPLRAGEPEQPACEQGRGGDKDACALHQKYAGKGDEQGGENGLALGNGVAPHSQPDACKQQRLAVDKVGDGQQACRADENEHHAAPVMPPEKAVARHAAAQEPEAGVEHAGEAGGGISIGCPRCEQALEQLGGLHV